MSQTPWRVCRPPPREQESKSTSLEKRDAAAPQRAATAAPRFFVWDGGALVVSETAALSASGRLDDGVLLPPLSRLSLGPAAARHALPRSEIYHRSWHDAPSVSRARRPGRSRVRRVASIVKCFSLSSRKKGLSRPLTSSVSFSICSVVIAASPNHEETLFIALSTNACSSRTQHTTHTIAFARRGRRTPVRHHACQRHARPLPTNPKTEAAWRRRRRFVGSHNARRRRRRLVGRQNARRQRRRWRRRRAPSRPA